MGQFSWITQDTNEPIRECCMAKPSPFTVAYMHDNEGNVWEERAYQGYGIFGGKDYYELLAEMNGVTHESIVAETSEDSFEYWKKHSDNYLTNLMRLKGIDLANVNTGEKQEGVLYPNLTRQKEWEWVDDMPLNDPNQGWG